MQTAGIQEAVPVTSEVVEGAFETGMVAAPGKPPLFWGLVALVGIVAGAAFIYGGVKGAQWLGRMFGARKDRKAHWAEQVGQGVSDKDALLAGFGRISALEERVGAMASTPEQRLVELGEVVSKGDTRAQLLIAEAARIFLPTIQALGIKTSPNLSPEDAAQVATVIVENAPRNEKGQFVAPQ